MNIGTVNHAHWSCNPSLPVAQRPVGHLIWDQIGIWDDHLWLVKGPDRCRPEADPFYFSPIACNFNSIADPNRLLKEQDKAADKIIDDSLQAETDTHAKGTQDDGELGQVKPEQHDCHEKANKYYEILD